MCMCARVCAVRRCIFFESKAVNSKVHRNTKKKIRSVFGSFHCGIFETRTFRQILFCPWKHVCILVPVHGLLEYPIKFGLRPILRRWRWILRTFSAILRFGAMDPDLPLFLLHLRTAFFEAHLLSPQKLGNSGSRKVTRYSWNSPIPLLQPTAHPRSFDVYH